ncbi:hypothetical protein [Oribacterium sp. P6A1]|uniref:hypothetical protein n=1 Tax=Oribacterium sp. P6A1 TaxID=1410612 RepID=UPI000A56FE3D|nr:hypothetical protein [Oribacterium sp. P6A1]
MEYTGLQCHGCGSTNVTFDPKTRLISCNQCGKTEYYSRATLGANGKVAFSRDNAIKFFKEGMRENARRYAQDVLNIMQDNAVALFIMAYEDEFYNGKEGSMKRFFATMMDVALEYDEVTELMDLFVISAHNMVDFEEQMLKMAILNLQGKEDREKLSNFADDISKFCISKRSSADFLTSDMAELYRDIAENCDIPGTCLMLIKGIKDNPSSPYRNNSFYMKGNTRLFYDKYVVPVGNIITAMKPNDHKAKFVSVYNKFRVEYEKDAAF